MTTHNDLGTSLPPIISADGNDQLPPKHPTGFTSLEADLSVNWHKLNLHQLPDEELWNVVRLSSKGVE